MRITIDIHGDIHGDNDVDITSQATGGTQASASSLTSPAYGSGDGVVATATDEASAAVVARRTGAVNAGAAPAGPGLPSAGSDQLAVPAADAAWTGAAESAGAAPTERG